MSVPVSVDPDEDRSKWDSIGSVRLSRRFHPLPGLDDWIVVVIARVAMPD